MFIFWRAKNEPKNSPQKLGSSNYLHDSKLLIAAPRAFLSVTTKPPVSSLLNWAISLKGFPLVTLPIYPIILNHSANFYGVINYSSAFHSTSTSSQDSALLPKFETLSETLIFTDFTIGEILTFSIQNL